MSSIFQIDAQLEGLIDQAVDHETGEINPEFENSLTTLFAERDQKIENIAVYVKELNARAEAIKTEMEVLAKRKKVAENRSLWLKQLLTDTLAGETYESAKVKVSYRKSSKVVVSPDLDLEKLWRTDKEYVRRNITFAIDKTIAKGMIQRGEKIKGIELVEARNLQVK